MAALSTDTRPPATTARERKQNHKSLLACNYCRSKKIKCNSGRPCPNCVDHKVQCDYSGAQRRSALQNKDYRGLQDRLRRVEALLSTTPPRNSVSTDRADGAPPVVGDGSHGLFQSFNFQMERIEDPHAAGNPFPTIAANDPPPIYMERNADADQPPPTGVTPCGESTSVNMNINLPTLPPTPYFPTRDHITEEPRSSNMLTFESPSEDDGSSRDPPEQNQSYEYHGPGSFLSICSKSGVEWVNEKTGVGDFGTIAQGLISDVSRALKLNTSIPTAREPEPTETDAWLYCRLYFQEDPDATFGIIYRPTFEKALRAHFREDGNHSDAVADPGWYALRNTIYATGCRIVESTNAVKGSGPSATSSKSWRYFLNALSVHSDLLFHRTSMMAVQALAAMSFFVEAIGYPSIDYMLCSSAMRLAQSKGIHRQPPTAWNLSKQAIKSRSFLWWSIYGFERVNASRSGRPLSINDSDITCQLPIECSEEFGVNMELITAAIEHSKLSAKINGKIAELKQRQTGLQELSDTFTDLTHQLDTWWLSLPDFVKLDLRSVERVLPPSVYFQQVVYHHFAYYGSLVAIHSILVHPWNSLMLKIELHDQKKLGRMVSRSMEVYVNATRKFINDFPHLDVNFLMPKWLVFIAPLTALINLFIYILQNPQSPSVDSDIGLMYVVAGHFSYLEFAIPERSFPFVRQMANLARLAVYNARKRSLTTNIGKDLRSDSYHGQAANNQQNEEAETLQHVNGNCLLRSTNPQQADGTSTPEKNMLEAMDLDMDNNEQWATLIGWPEGDELFNTAIL